jgi:CelD/BcsL family acetyltransferase involved in cellulose biosynthesis
VARTPDTEHEGARAAGGHDPVEVVRLERLDDLKDDWVRLAERAGHPFATWEWSSCWWRALGADRRLYSFACRDRGGEVVAILPLQATKTGPFRIARFIGDGDLRSPVCAPEHREVAVACMRDAIRSGSDSCTILLAERMPGDEGWGALLGGREVATHPDPVMHLKGKSWDELLASRSRNFRQQVRRRERRLVEEHGLSFRLSTDPDRLQADLDALFRLHGERWGEETSGVFMGARGDFNREFAAAAQARGWLRLWMAEIGGETVAAWYGWRFAGSEWYYQAGRDRRFDDLSLGFVLLAHTVREACNDGVDAYRFLNGAESYKWRFAEDDLCAESRVFASGAWGGLGARAISAAARMPPFARRRIVRSMG